MHFVAKFSTLLIYVAKDYRRNFHILERFLFNFIADYRIKILNLQLINNFSNFLQIDAARGRLRLWAKFRISFR